MLARGCEVANEKKLQGSVDEINLQNCWSKYWTRVAIFESRNLRERTNR